MKLFEVLNLIIQAGGRGSRLEHLTKHKPKALVCIENKPLIFHYFERFKNSNIIVIGDYKAEVLEEYIKQFADRDIKFVNAQGLGKGSSVGISQSLEHIDNNLPVGIVWCDLLFSDASNSELNLETDLVGVTDQNQCRYVVRGGRIVKGEYLNPATGDIEPEPVWFGYQGVFGLTVFQNKGQISKVLKPEGEFVKTLMEVDHTIQAFRVNGVTEIGTLERYNNVCGTPSGTPCRSFNKITYTEDGEAVIKEPTTEFGKKVMENEINWYKNVHSAATPYAYFAYNDTDNEALTLSRIEGKHPHELELSTSQKIKLVTDIVLELKKIHNYLEPISIPTIRADTKLMYFSKTIDRLKKIENLVPFANYHEIKINGHNCLNPLHRLSIFENLTDMLTPEEFYIIHGDPTFSNTLINPRGVVYFIDPRGIFGNSKLYGDVYYDIAKLYYSAVGNYDQFNKKTYELKIDAEGVELEIASSEYEHCGNVLIDGLDRDKIKIIHAIIWLSLTTYVWEDFEMMCAAFYNGVYHLRNYL